MGKETKKEKQIEAEKNQLPVKEMTITIVWKKSRVWGYNPHASVDVEFHAGTYAHVEGFKCSGCGYDKESEVISQVFNNLLLYKLWAFGIRKLNNSKVYGINAGKYDGLEYRSYAGAIGTSCYYTIAHYIGGQLEKIASGETFDVYKYTDKRKRLTK